MDIETVEDFIAEHKPDIGIIAVPKSAAGPVALRLANAGIRDF